MARAGQSLDAFGSISCPYRARLLRFTRTLEKLHNVSLGVPCYLWSSGTGEERLTSVKQFCSGLLGRCKHPWRPALRGLPRPARFSVGMSIFLFRKVLPSSAPSVRDFVDRMSVESPDPDQCFLDFVRTEVPKLFRKGWDERVYERAAVNSVLTLSSCTQVGRSRGGCRMFGLEGKDSIFQGRQGFIDAVLHSSRFPSLKPSRAVSIETAGKHRIVTVPDGNMSLLRPLHTIMYNHLSRFPWLLRGDAKPSKFKDFSTLSGEVFVSGDYESATDNLNQHVQKEILRLILQQCSSVPNGVRLMAMESLSLFICSSLDPRPVKQQRGQMMGNLVSFPLLCLVNFLAFKYFVPRRVPLRINGDDIVFRATPTEAGKWMEGVKAAGLSLSKGKTLVDSRCFSLNSCLFYSSRRGADGLPFVRAKSFFPEKGQEAILGLKGRFLSFSPNLRGRRRSELRVQWLRENVGLINASRRSLTRGLGLPVKLDEVMAAGLWDREGWYLSFEAERPVPCPLSEWRGRPAGYQYCRVEKVTKEILREQKGVAEAFVKSAWEPPSGDCEWEEDLVANCPNWNGFSYLRRLDKIKRAKLLGLSVANMKRYLRPSRDLFHERANPKLHRVGVWRPSQPTVESVQIQEEERGEQVESSWCSLHTSIGLIAMPTPVGDVFEDGEWVRRTLRSDPPPRYGAPSHKPIVPPDCLTQHSPGRKVVFRDGVMRGCVCDR
jgi:hypothetical protein